MSLTTRDGRPVEWQSCPIIWGEPGSNAQHSFYQLLHQGTRRFAADFIVPVNGSSDFQRQQDIALANCLAQAEALMVGQSEVKVAAALRHEGLGADEVEYLAPHKVHPGNRPSSIYLFPRLDPEMLRRLVALYEHKVFVQSVIWDINAFDQWGVELGKSARGSGGRGHLRFECPPKINSSVQSLLRIADTWRE